MQRRPFRLLAIAVVLVAAGAGLAARGAAAPGRGQPQQPVRPTFRSSSSTVVLDVSVLDRERRPVRGLTAADFTVVEDGQPQAVTTFTAIDLPDVEAGSVSWTREVAPEVQSNESVRDRQLVIIVLDDATPMPAAEGPRVKELARKFISQLGPADLAAVVFPLNAKGGQDFTDDRARLLRAVERFSGSLVSESDPMKSQPLASASRSSRGASDTSSDGGFKRYRFDEFDPNALTLYQAAVGTLEFISAQMSALSERRKAIVFISVGVPFDPDDLATRQSLSDGNNAGEMSKRLKERMEGAFRRAQEGNVNIYAVDPGGLRAGMPRDMMRGRPIGELNQDFLRTVSESTGGFVVSDNNELDHGLGQVLRENHAYYLLGYQSSKGATDGKFRRVEVKVNRPGITVRSRSGYYGTARSGGPGDTPVPGAGLLPKTDLAMDVWAGAFAGTSPTNATVAVALGIRQESPPGDKGGVDNVTVQVAAFDEKGAVKASERVSFRLRLDASASGAASYQVLSRLDVPPGRYQVRLTAESSLRDKSGSASYDIDVPDFAKGPLVLSGVAIAVAPAAVSAPADRFANLLPVLPSTAREFDGGQQVSAFVRVSQGGSSSTVPVPVTTTILDSKGVKVFESSSTLPAESFRATRSAEYSMAIPLDGLAPGLHLLTIEANTARARARKDVRFTMRER